LIIIISVVYHQKGLVLLNAKVILTLLDNQNQAFYEGEKLPLFIPNIPIYPWKIPTVRRGTSTSDLWVVGLGLSSTLYAKCVTICT